MRKNKSLSYLERKALIRSKHEWLKNSSKWAHILLENNTDIIDVPVENDVKMDKVRHHRLKKNG